MGLDARDLDPTELRHLPQGPAESVHEHDGGTLRFAQLSQGSAKTRFDQRVVSGSCREHRAKATASGLALPYSEQVAHPALQVAGLWPGLPRPGESLGCRLRTTFHAEDREMGASELRLDRIEERLELADVGTLHVCLYSRE